MKSPGTNGKTVTLVGAGPVGSLLALFLARRGLTVEIFERRPDMRVHGVTEGRSINLALSTRGIYGLEQVGLKDEVLKRAIPMWGRMMHSREGELAFQKYGRDDKEYINSVSRGELNMILMTAAEQTECVKIHFNHRVTGVDFAGKKLKIERVGPGAAQSAASVTHPYDILIGTDGSASVIRTELTKEQSALAGTEDVLNYGYKEFHIPPGKGGKFLMEKNALHIWPRGNYMLIALPNGDGSFTATLFLPFEGIPSFAKLKTAGDIEKLFRDDFRDVLDKMPDLDRDFAQHPVGHMITVKTFPWGREDVLLMGDAAHAIVPFFGQGMNCGFEDCSVLAELIGKKADVDWNALFNEFQGLRKGNCDAIADMAIENFVEMRDKVGDKKFLLQKKVEQALQKKFPDKYVSRYAMVTFSRVPYQEALKAGRAQEKILEKLCRGIDSAEDVNWSEAEILVKEMQWT